MTLSVPPDSSRRSRLEEVLGEYMQRLDRGEAVDREQFLARHPEWAEELRSYFAGSDELERLGRRAEGERPAFPPTGTLPEPGRVGGASRAEGNVRRVGDYELLEQIGQGGMGVIYKARQQSLARLVALKMIRPDRLASPADVLRFRSEAEAAASLDHPNIVPIYEVGEHEGQHYFSMKLVEGGNLCQLRIADCGLRIEEQQRAVARILALVARAVHHAHQRGVLHRDLKPANVLLEWPAADSPQSAIRNPQSAIPYVTDFGLAKRLAAPGTQPPGLSEPAGPGLTLAGPGSGRLGADLTQQGMIVGTPDYMAPEQASAKGGVSTAADVYSLGAILYEFLTGRPPFRAETPLDTLLQLREREPTPPCRLNPRVDRDLETVCLKCLHKEPSQRYRSAEALADDLERWLRGEPIRARPVGRLERARKWARRRPELAALAVLLVFVFLAGFAGVCWQWARAEGEYRKAAEHAEAERATAYARAIALAHAEWRAGNAGSADEILDTCPAELRGWEWHYLRRLFRARQLATLDGGAGGVRAVAFSPDGARLASAGADGTVRVWDRQAAREVLTLRGPDDDAITAVAFSPDGRRLAGGSAAGALRVWDAAQGEEVVTWRGHAAGVTGLAFDPDGRRLASTGKGEQTHGELKLWDPTDGRPLAGATWDNILAAVAFSPDGRRLVTAGHDEIVAVWDAAALDRIGALKGQTAWAVPWSSVAYSADGRWVAAGSPAGVVRVWDAATAQELFSAVTPAQAGVSGLAFGGEDGRFLAAATAGNTVQGWVVKSGKPAFTLRGHRRAVTAVAWSPDGAYLASASLDRTVKLWDLGSPDEALTLRGHGPNQGITAVAFSPDCARLAAATRDRTLQVWAAETGEQVFTLTRLPGTVSGVAFSPDGSRIASADADGTVWLREAATGREVAALRCPGGAVHAVAFSPDGGRLAAAGDEGVVRVWEVPAGREVAALRCPGGAVRAVAFSPDGGRLAAAGDEGVARVWDAAGGRELLALGRPDEPVYAVAFSPDGRCLATACQDEAIRVWDAAGALVRTLRGHAGAVRGLAYGPGGRLASAGDDGVVRLWDAAGRELLTLRGHTEAVRAVAFSRDGCRLASGGDDRTIRVWDATPLEEMSAQGE
jgi:WD40 repeat protein/serine/threonine protein kinase